MATKIRKPMSMKVFIFRETIREIVRVEPSIPKEFKRCYVTREEIQVGNKCIKRFSTLLVIKKMWF